jgi:hypothetical protein
VVDNDELLTEIRDLLVPISSLARMKLGAEAPDKLRVVVGSGQRQRAARMMDGTKTRQDIQTATGISAPNLSTLMKELREAGLATEREGRPRLVVGPAGVWAKGTA